MAARYAHYCKSRTMSDIAGNDKTAEAAMRIFLAHHEKFHFALQDKYEELIKYAQRKDASQFLIDKGNREIKKLPTI